MLYKGTASQADIAGQVNLVNDMVSRKVSGVMIAATDAKALVDPVEKAVAAGVPVVTLDSGVDSQKPYAYIATDNIAAAKTAADVLGGLIAGKGTVGDIGITAGSQTGREREDGFVKQIKAKYPEVKVLAVQYTGCDPAKSLNIATDMLTGNPGLVGFYGACDGPGTGIAQLVKQRNLKGKIKSVSFDVSPDQFLLFLDGYLDALHRSGSVPDGVPRRVRDGPGDPQAAGQGQAGRHPGQGRDAEEHQPAGHLRPPGFVRRHQVHSRGEEDQTGSVTPVGSVETSRADLTRRADSLVRSAGTRTSARGRVPPIAIGDPGDEGGADVPRIAVLRRAAPSVTDCQTNGRPPWQ